MQRNKINGKNRAFKKIYFLYCCILIICLLAISWSNASITGKLTGISPQQENIILENQITEISPQTENEPKSQDYEFYWAENKEKINNIFNSHIKKYHKIDCIDYNQLRSLLQPNQKIKKIAKNLTHNSTTELETAYILHQFVYNNIKYAEIDNPMNPAQILLSKKGDCSEKAILLNSLLKSINIDSYIADGNKHKYIFVKIDNIWAPIDPSYSIQKRLYPIKTGATPLKEVI